MALPGGGHGGRCSLAEEVSEEEMSDDEEREAENHILVGKRPYPVVPPSSIPTRGEDVSKL